MPDKPITEPKDEPTFEESLKENIYFTTRGCEERGSIKIDKTLFNFIYNISGMCTDKGETEDYFKNPRAMFVALDLIYKAFNEVEQSEREQERLRKQSPKKEGQ